jgi:hypothetical protein
MKHNREIYVNDFVSQRRRIFRIIRSNGGLDQNVFMVIRKPMAEATFSHFLTQDFNVIYIGSVAYDFIIKII